MQCVHCVSDYSLAVAIMDSARAHLLEWVCRGAIMGSMSQVEANKPAYKAAIAQLTFNFKAWAGLWVIVRQL